MLRCGGMSSYLRPAAPQIGVNRKETAMDTLLLSRIQFAANISFHILFPTITIALGWLLLWFRLRFNRTGDQAYMDAYFFWVKVFALSFAMGVVSGITMSFQFGTNWPGFMESVGNIAGPLLAYEVLTAFFLEAVFLGIMLFGFRRVSGRVHTLATFLVAFGTTMSAFWILVLNSWMHTPQGYEIRDGVAYATDWLAIVFNPSMPYRLVHVLLASGLTVAFLVAGLSALRWLFGDRGRANMLALRTGLTLGAVLIPLQILAGDLHGLNTLEHQPQKVAAMEGNWETGPRVPLMLFAIPDEEARENRFEIGIPGGASLILKHDIDGVVPGLNDFVAEDGTVLHPPVTAVLRLPHHGRYRFRHAVRRLDRQLDDLAPGRHQPAAGLCAGADGPVGLGRHPCGLVHHRDRPSALAGQRRAENRRRRHHGSRELRRDNACSLPAGLCRSDRRLSVGHRGACAQGRQGTACSRPA
jgi:cytochrome bd-type quinol oxidase subunit 1